MTIRALGLLAACGPVALAGFVSVRALEAQAPTGRRCVR
jgi:hypothetical protein